MDPYSATNKFDVGFLAFRGSLAGSCMRSDTGSYQPGGKPSPSRRRLLNQAAGGISKRATSRFHCSNNEHSKWYLKLGTPQMMPLRRLPLPVDKNDLTWGDQHRLGLFRLVSADSASI